ncbi:ejaculatory bulb-specific protein 3-like [Microplitis mediator]|uniref:ejaculatory bulb-specific protein 3-like n=1 Tax=Microplitis mediator TaxID=375433 RepID=UPI0025526BE4|nr:ejaculatory bulb-specific protein 3-like [Microplitis mediator]
MKIFVVLLVGLTMQGAISALETITVPPGFSVESVLNNNRLMRNYIQCLTGEVKCNNASQKVKTVVVSSLKNDCSNCDANVKVNAEKMIKFMIERRPADWAKLTAKYDPSGAITRKYRAMMEQDKSA